MITSSNQLIVVLTTFANIEDAGRVAHSLVGEGLCACVNLVPQLRSIYKWQGEIVTNSEILGIIKTTAAAQESLTTRLRELHTYEVPEIVVIAADAVGEGYLRWVLDEVGPPTTAADPPPSG
jgi:periplasmic divalent cation tolerance protein